VLIQLRDTNAQITRNRQITFNVLKPTREAIKALASKEGLTMSAILRRAIYEYTKPVGDDNLLAMYDGWGDVS
jgi:predicted DNA binding CopG/RHH family protein